MATTRAFTSSMGCTACHRQILNIFISSMRPTLRLPIREPLPKARRLARNVTTSASRRSDVVATNEANRRMGQAPSGLEALEAQVAHQEGSAAAEQEAEREVPPAEDAEPDPTSESTPWYLSAQEEAEVPTNPFAERQRLPELPPHPPPVLQPLLKHISIDLGLDYLNLIDLRLLDPPPALGANLIMLFGTARSEKHLNVSADRLCRWLRSNYKLSPHADGLLGRNELKLKLRRKARRSRMLGAAGASETPNADDGITTGWICVDVGSVENGADAPTPHSLEEREGFVGFGRRTDQAKIVVQMMTEEKRGEVDLEGLWQGALEREHRKREGEKRAREKREQAQPGVDEHLAEPDVEMQKSSQDRRLHTFPTSTSTSYPAQQVRGFHSCTRRRADAARFTPDIELNEDELEPHLLPSTGMLARKNDRSNARDSAGQATSTLSLRTHLDYIQKLKPSVAISLLGNGDGDTESTSFLRDFYAAIPAFPDRTHLLSELDLHCYAIEIGAPGYTRSYLLALFRQLQMAGFTIPQEAFHRGLRTLMLSPHSLDATSERKDPAFDGLNALKQSLALSFDLLEQMEANGHEARSETVFLTILEGIAYPRFADAPNTPDDQRLRLASHAMDKLLHNFNRALLHQPVYNAPAAASSSSAAVSRALPPEAMIKICHALLRVSLHHVLPSQIWDAWRMPARLLLARPAGMYESILNGIADQGHEKAALIALENVVPEMVREDPKVEMTTNIARGIIRCLRVSAIDVTARPYRDWFDKARVVLEAHMAREREAYEDM